MDPLGVGILPIEGDGFDHLGAPVGDATYVQRKVKDRVDKVEALLEKLPSLENPHGEYNLLRSCFSVPKVSYLLRTCPPTVPCLQHWKKFD